MQCDTFVVANLCIKTKEPIRLSLTESQELQETTYAKSGNVDTYRTIHRLRKQTGWEGGLVCKI